MAATKNNDEHFYFAPFGGMPDGKDDGIGANCSIITHQIGDKTTRIMMDFGVKLPNNEMKEKFQDINAIMPDFTLFFDTKDSKAKYPVDAIFLTHAHADHIDGLVPVFINAKQNGIKLPPIYGSRNTLLTLLDNLKEKFILTNDYSFSEIKPFKEISVGLLSVIPVPVPHTPAESYGFLVHKDRKNALFNPGDHRSIDSHTSFGGNNGILSGVLRKIEVTGMLMDSTSTGIKRDPKTEITLQTALDSLQQIFDENKGKQIFTPIISRATENLLPFLLKAKENNKTVFFDGFRLRQAFRRWQELNSFYYRDSNGQLAECRNRKELKKLREKGIELYCAEDFRNNVFDFDNVMRANAENYLKKISKGHRLIVMSGAFAEKTDTDRSGAVRLAEADHQFFKLDKETVVIHSQRAITGLNHEGVIDLVNMEARQGAKIYANSFGVYLGDFVTYMPLQPSGHDNADSAYEFMNFIMENAKNAKDFNKNNPFVVLGIHGGKNYRETTAAIAEKSNSMKGYVPSNYGIYEYKSGSVTEISNTPLENQRYFAITGVPKSGQLVLVPINGYNEKNGEEDIILPLEIRTGDAIRSRSDAIREKALTDEERFELRQSNKERKAQKNRETFKSKHGSVRKAKKQKNKEDYNKNKQNKKNAGKIRQYTGRY